MGSIIEKINDDINEYESICRYLKINLRYNNYHYDIYNHTDEIYKKLNVRNYSEFWSKMKELEKEGWNLKELKYFFDII